MIRTVTCLIMIMFALPSSANSNNQNLRSDTNFGFGGATTYSDNATDLFAPTLGPVIRGAGLDLIGLSQQLEFAGATLGNVDSERDVFWVWAGTNNILIDSITGSSDPSRAAADLTLALEDLYLNKGARIFVVPNLMLLGNLPLFNTTEETQNGINYLTQQQNTHLAEALDEFALDFTDATVIPLDVQTLFTELESSPSFDNTTESCFATGLPNGLSCSNYLYADDIHFSSAAAGQIAQLAANQLEGIDVRRLITFGDSFVDTGSLYDTTIRTLGFGIPTAPSYEGRFTEGLNVIDQVEILLDVDVSSTAFIQPSRLTVDSTSNTVLDGSLEVIVPHQITLDTPVYFFSRVKIKFKNNGFCFYRPESFLSYTLTVGFCSKSTTPGETVTTSQISLKKYFVEDDVSLDMFYYQ